MKKGMLILFLSILSYFLYGDIFDNALIGSQLAMRENGRMNYLNDLPVRIEVSRFYGKEKSPWFTLNLDYIIIENKLIKHTTISSNSTGNKTIFDYIYKPGCLEILRKRSNSEKVEKEEYCFSDGNISIWKTYNKRTNELFSTYKFYYENNHLVKITDTSTRRGEIETNDQFQFTWNNGEIINCKRGRTPYLYSYIKDENIVLVEEQPGINYDYERNPPLRKYIREYDDDGKLIHELYDSIVGEFKFFEEYLTYDEKGRIKSVQHLEYHKIEEIDKKGSNYIEEFYYDENLPMGDELFDLTKLSFIEKPVVEVENQDGEIEGETNFSKTGIIVVGSVFSVVVIALIILFILKRKKRV